MGPAKHQANSYAPGHDTAWQQHKTWQSRGKTWCMKQRGLDTSLSCAGSGFLRLKLVQFTATF